jgi:hypothetical protein
MTLHIPRLTERKIRPVLERVKKDSLSNPMITACSEPHTETAWFFATRSDGRPEPCKILPMTSVHPYKSQSSFRPLTTPFLASLYFPVRPYIRHTISLILECCTVVYKCVRVWGVLANLALLRTFSMLSPMQSSTHITLPYDDMTYDTPYIWETNYIQNPFVYKKTFSTCTCHLRHVHSTFPHHYAKVTLTPDPPYATRDAAFFTLENDRSRTPKNVRSKFMYVGWVSTILHIFRRVIKVFLRFDDSSEHMLQKGGLNMMPYKLYVADKTVDSKNLEWREVLEDDRVMSLLMVAVELLPRVQEDEIEYVIVAPDGEFVVTSLYMDEDFMKGGTLQ